MYAYIPCIYYLITYMVAHSHAITSSGGSGGGAGGPWPLLILGKKEEMTEGIKASRAGKSRLPPPP